MYTFVPFVEEYPGCYLRTATHCAKEFFMVLAEEDTSKICRQVTLSSKCMMSAVKYCPSLHQNAMITITNQMTLTSKAMCGSLQCNVKAAKMCMAYTDVMMHEKDEKDEKNDKDEKDDREDMSIVSCGVVTSVREKMKHMPAHIKKDIWKELSHHANLTLRMVSSYCDMDEGKEESEEQGSY
ncbi:hypothetical protein FSP39_015334 [Pinctada imbricata]|uniref:Uncharacterized protein n=1 Tax=Pinctada imbricata TaxID=66713 RepID=A0AA88Y9I0_PINIB|nr:hypothetical protein FSP39_015334 [Pinctada imbricata]